MNRRGASNAPDLTGVGADVHDPALRCPPWCVLDAGHVATEFVLLGTAVLHRGAETTITCRSTEVAAPVHDTVQVRVSRQRWIEFDHAGGRWVGEPHPTVQVAGMPDFPLQPADARALAVALVVAAAGEAGTAP